MTGSGYDVVVVGAGPAGSAAALSMARLGASVLMVDRADFPRWKVCGGCLGPAAFRLLDELGLGEKVRGAGAVALEAMVLRAGSRRARIRLQGSMALSRVTLDALLADAVVEAGGEVRFGVGVHGVEPQQEGVELRVRVDGEERRVDAGVVVDATGLGGLVLDDDGSHEAVAEGSRVGLGAVFGAGRPYPLPPGELRMLVGPEGYVGMVRLEDGSLNVAAAVDRTGLGRYGPRGVVERIVASAGSSLPDAEPRLGWRGTPALTRTPDRAARGRVLRVGDAAGYVEPFTGEGMGWALSAGIAVAPFARRVLDAVPPDAGPLDRGPLDSDSLDAGPPLSGSWETDVPGAGLDEAARGWAAARRRAVGQGLCRFLAASLRRPALVELGVGLVGRMPALARPLVRSTGDVPDAVLRSAARARARAAAR